MPEALKAVIPAIVGQFISLFKDTSLLAIVGLVDLLGMAGSVLANPKFIGDYPEVYLFLAFIYWIIPAMRECGPTRCIQILNCLSPILTDPGAASSRRRSRHLKRLWGYIRTWPIPWKVDRYRRTKPSQN